MKKVQMLFQIIITLIFITVIILAKPWVSYPSVSPEMPVIEKELEGMLLKLEEPAVTSIEKWNKENAGSVKVGFKPLERKDKFIERVKIIAKENGYNQIALNANSDAILLMCQNNKFLKYIALNQLKNEVVYLYIHINNKASKSFITTPSCQTSGVDLKVYR